MATRKPSAKSKNAAKTKPAATRKSAAKNQSESKDWDSALKTLAQASPQDLVSWFVKGGVYKGEQNIELQKNALLIKDPIRADLLYTIEVEGQEGILHVEFQSSEDERMDRRVWEYSSAASLHTGMPVYSIVIYLVDPKESEKSKKSIVEPPYQMEFPPGYISHQCNFQNIKMWEIPPEVLKQQNLPGLLPLLSLTKESGGRPEVVEDMIQSLEQAGRTDLLPLGYLLSSYTFTEEDKKQWLKERFNKMKDMLKDNWAYHEMVQWAEEDGEKRGLEQGLQAQRATLVKLVERYFPNQLALAKQQVGLITTLPQARELIDKLFAANTGDEVRQILLAIPQA